jgi:hypothetical protein
MYQLGQCYVKLATDYFNKASNCFGIALKLFCQVTYYEKPKIDVTVNAQVPIMYYVLQTSRNWFGNRHLRLLGTVY